MGISSSHEASSELTVIEREMFKGEYAKLEEVINNDPAEITISSEDRKILPPQFLDIANKLHQNYLYWKHLRNTQKTTKPTFYLHTREGITQAAAKVAETGTPIDQEILLILEARIALMTINSLMLAAEEYLQANYLQNAKESVDTALSTLYEFIKTREQLEPSLEAAVASIRQDIANEPEANQYASYLVTQILRLQCFPLISEPKFYVVRNQLEKLGETLVLLIPDDINAPLSKPVGKQQIDALMTRLLLAMVEQEAYITTITHKYLVDDISFSPDGTYLATASEDGTAKLVEVATGREVTNVRHRGGVKAVSFSPNGTYLATASGDKTAKLIEVATGREVTTITHWNEVKAVSFSHDGTYLVTISDDNTAKLLEVATGRKVTTIGHGYWINTISFSPDGTYLATASGDKTAKLTEVATGRKVTTIRHKDWVQDVSFSPDGTYLATASFDRTTKLVEIATGIEVITIRHLDKVRNVLFSPDGTYLTTVSDDNTAKLVEVATGREVITIKHLDKVRNVLFSPDGTYLATASDDNTAKLVEVATGIEATTIKHLDKVRNVLFSPDGTYLATASDDNTVKLVNLGKLSQRVIEEENHSDISQPEISAIVHMDKPEAFFLTWLRTASNTQSFYEYMLRQAKQEKEGLAARYNFPVLKTHLLLESLVFLLINAEKHYQTLYPILIGIDKNEVHIIAMQDTKQSISAALSSLYEFIAQRMKLDGEEYQQAIERLQQEIREKIDSSELSLTIYNKLQSILQFEGIKNRGELKTTKDMLDQMQNIFKQILPEDIRPQNREIPVIPLKRNLEKREIVNIINEVEEADLIPLLSRLNNLGILNHTVALAAIRKITPQRILELCKFLPQEVIDQEVALEAIHKRRKTHYIGTLSPWTDITNKEILLKILKSAPPKTWYRR